MTGGAQLRAELLKQRSTMTVLGLAGGMIGLVTLAELVHALGLPIKNLASLEDQLSILGRGQFLATLFAGLLGALSVTAEFRHGTIRPTLLSNPHRGRVLAAKVWSSMLYGAGLGLVGCALAAAVGGIALESRGVDVQLSSGDFVLLVVGGTAGAALWGALGAGIAAVVRSQVPTLVGICAWLLFVESLIVGDFTGLTQVGRFAPGALSSAMSGQTKGDMLAPGVAAGVLILYVVVTVAAGIAAMNRRDVA